MFLEILIVFYLILRRRPMTLKVCFTFGLIVAAFISQASHETWAMDPDKPNSSRRGPKNTQDLLAEADDLLASLTLRSASSSQLSAPTRKLPAAVPSFRDARPPAAYTSGSTRRHQPAPISHAYSSALPSRGHASASQHFSEPPPKAVAQSSRTSYAPVFTAHSLSRLERSFEDDFRGKIPQSALAGTAKTLFPDFPSYVQEQVKRIKDKRRQLDLSPSSFSRPFSPSQVDEEITFLYSMEHFILQDLEKEDRPLPLVLIFAQEELLPVAHITIQDAEKTLRFSYGRRGSTLSETQHAVNRSLSRALSKLKDIIEEKQHIEWTHQSKKPQRQTFLVLSYLQQALEKVNLLSPPLLEHPPLPARSFSRPQTQPSQVEIERDSRKPVTPSVIKTISSSHPGYYVPFPPEIESIFEQIIQVKTHLHACLNEIFRAQQNLKIYLLDESETHQKISARQQRSSRDSTPLSVYQETLRRQKTEIERNTELLARSSAKLPSLKKAFRETRSSLLTYLDEMFQASSSNLEAKNECLFLALRLAEQEFLPAARQAIVSFQERTATEDDDASLKDLYLEKETLLENLSGLKRILDKQDFTSVVYPSLSTDGIRVSLKEINLISTDTPEVILANLTLVSSELRKLPLSSKK